MPRHTTTATHEELTGYFNTCDTAMKDGAKMAPEFYLGAMAAIDTLETMEGNNPIAFLTRLERFATMQLGLYEEVE